MYKMYLYLKAFYKDKNINNNNFDIYMLRNNFTSEKLRFTHKRSSCDNIVKHFKIQNTRKSKSREKDVKLSIKFNGQTLKSSFHNLQLLMAMSYNFNQNSISRNMHVKFSYFIHF